MKVIYQPKGRAQEYAESEKGAGDGYAVNLYRGCTHGCAYCYVPTMPPWKFEAEARRRFHATVYPRPNLLRNLAADCDAMEAAGLLGAPLHLCFTCDPYPLGIDPAVDVTREALEILEGAGFRNVQVLTKGGMAAARDFDIMARNGWKFGQTITTNDKAPAAAYEPNAATIGNRLKALAEAKAAGVYTWVSVEPVTDTWGAWALVVEARGLVDLWKIGKLNHGADISQELGEIEAQTDWAFFLHSIVEQLEYQGDAYLIKDSLAAFARKPEGGASEPGQ